jgi:hypothetical protein
VALHLATHSARDLLELPLCCSKGFFDGDGEMFFGRFIVAASRYYHILVGRNGEPNGDLVGFAAPMSRIGPDDRYTAIGDGAMDALQMPHLVLDLGADVGRRLHIFEIDPDWDFHIFLSSRANSTAIDEAWFDPV